MSATITDEQFAARELVRSWAAGTGAPDTVRDVEDGRTDAWRPVYDGVAELGLFGVAIVEEAGGAGGSIVDLCAMVEEAARALIPGPVATTALASLVVTDPALLQALSSGQITAGAALTAEVRADSGRVSGTADYVLGALATGLLLLPVYRGGGVPATPQARAAALHGWVYSPLVYEELLFGTRPVLLIYFAT